MQILLTIILLSVTNLLFAAWTDSLSIAFVIRDHKAEAPLQIKLFSHDSIELHSINVKQINDSTFFFPIRNHIDTAIHKSVRMIVYCKKTYFTILLNKSEYTKIPQLITIEITKVKQRKIHFEFIYGIVGYLGTAELKKRKQ
jgi:hypothetical protein